MYYIGIDIGSTASKTVIFDGDELLENFAVPTGWNSKDTAESIYSKMEQKGISTENSKIVATGYGRISVPFANKSVTEITCHAKGAYYLCNCDCTVIDIGGQDTKVISVKNGNVVDFIMNDKCAAGTGRFLELMAGTLGLDITEMCKLSQKGSGVTISSMCTVFAESEVISLIGSGKSREDIAYGIVDSIVSKVKALSLKHENSGGYFLTGGLCENPYILDKLSDKLGKRVSTSPLGRYAGAIGAAIIAKTI